MHARSGKAERSILLAGAAEPVEAFLLLNLLALLKGLWGVDCSLNTPNTKISFNVVLSGDIDDFPIVSTERWNCQFT